MAAETPSTPPPPPARRGARWSVGHILLVVFGSIVALLGVALLGAGGTALWVDLTQRDDDGYLTTPTEPFETEIVRDHLREHRPPRGRRGRRVASDRGGARQGAHRRREHRWRRLHRHRCDRPGRVYLEGVEHDEVRDIDFEPFSVDTGGSRAASRPSRLASRTSGRPPPRARDGRAPCGKPSPATGRSCS